MEGKFKIEHLEDGQVVEEHVLTNLISTVGENHIIDVGPSPFGGPENPFVTEGHVIPVFQTEPPRTFTFQSPDGREAVLDFSGDEMTYSGDLPVAESAKIFFDLVLAHWRA